MNHNKTIWFIPGIPVLLLAIFSLLCLRPANSQVNDAPAPILDLRWHPQGQRFAQVDASGRLKVLNHEAHNTTVFEFNPGSLTLLFAQVAWNQDGSKLAAGIGHQVYIWETITWQMTGEYVAGNTDGQAYSEYLGDIPEGITTISWSQDGQLVSSGSVSSITTIWNNQDSRIAYQKVADFSGGFPGRVWLNNGILSDGSTNLNPSTEEVVLTYPSQNGYGSVGDITSIDISPDHSLLAKSGELGFVELVNPYSLTFINMIEVAESAPPEPRRAVQDISWDGSGDFIAAVTRDGEILIVNVATQVASTIGTLPGQLFTVDWNPHSNEILVGGVSDTGQALVQVMDVSGLAGVPALTPPG